MTPSRAYWRRLVAGIRTDDNRQEHYWRWPVMVRFRWIGWRWTFRVSLHGVRDGVVRGLGPFHPAVRSFLWLGPVGLEFGAYRQRIEDWRWRRSLRSEEGIR